MVMGLVSVSRLVASQVGDHFNLRVAFRPPLAAPYLKGG